MTTLKRWCAVVSLVIVWGVTMAAQQPTQQEQFIPVSELPPQEQLPAAPLLIGAYAFVLLVLFVYVFFVARRLTAVQQELERLDSSVKQGGRA